LKWSGVDDFFSVWLFQRLVIFAASGDFFSVWRYTRVGWNICTYIGMHASGT
jgi:hypothetical protein